MYSNVASYCTPVTLLRQEAAEPNQLIWIKARGKLNDDAGMHRCVAAYISDFALLSTALLPHPDLKVGMMASLDHSMWFHAPFRADEWLLCQMECLRSHGGRSLVMGRIFTQDGTLAVSVAQEGIIRERLSHL